MLYVGTSASNLRGSFFLVVAAAAEDHGMRQYGGRRQIQLLESFGAFRRGDRTRLQVHFVGVGTDFFQVLHLRRIRANALRARRERTNTSPVTLGETKRGKNWTVQTTPSSIIVNVMEHVFNMAFMNSIV